MAWRIRGRIGRSSTGDADPVKEKRAIYRAAAAYLAWLASRGEEVGVEMTALLLRIRAHMAKKWMSTLDHRESTELLRELLELTTHESDGSDAMGDET